MAEPKPKPAPAPSPVEKLTAENSQLRTRIVQLEAENAKLNANESLRQAAEHRARRVQRQRVLRRDNSDPFKRPYDGR